MSNATAKTMEMRQRSISTMKKAESRQCGASAEVEKSTRSLVEHINPFKADGNSHKYARLVAELGFLANVRPGHAPRIKCQHCRANFENIESFWHLVDCHRSSKACILSVKKPLPKEIGRVSGKTISDEAIVLLKSKGFFEVLKSSVEFCEGEKHNFQNGLDYVDFHKRLESFVGSPFLKEVEDSSCQLPNPVLMAASGFRFLGYGDCVECFYCKKKLRQFTPGDDAFYEHFRWFHNQCKYVRHVLTTYCLFNPEIKAAIDEISQVQPPPQSAASSSACELQKQLDHRRNPLDGSATTNNSPALSQTFRGCFKCRSNRADLLLEPCKHVCLCRACDSGGGVNVCPRCNQFIQNRRQVFLC